MNAQSEMRISRGFVVDGIGGGVDGGIRGALWGLFTFAITELTFTKREIGGNADKMERQ